METHIEQNMKPDPDNEVVVSQLEQEKQLAEEFLKNFDDAQEDGFVHFKDSVYFVERDSDAHKKILEGSADGGRYTYPLGHHEIEGRTFNKYQITPEFFSTEA
jgi:hypothetical protein